LIASGDIFSGALAKKMFDETGCDGLAEARGSLGNPWVFDEIKEYLKNGKIISRPEKEEIVKVMMEHLNASIDFYGEKNGVIIFRKFCIWYTRGLCKVRWLREKTSHARSRLEMEEIIDSLRTVSF
jgi:tRNA-dihydrouridine synthase B